MAPNGKTEKRSRWVNYNGSWRILKLSERDPRYAESAEYDPAAEDRGRPDARLSGADVREGRTVADIEQRLVDDKATGAPPADAKVTDKARRPGGRRPAGATARRSGTPTASDSDEN